MDGKTMAFIESDGMRLCIEMQNGIATHSSAFHQKFKNGTAHTAAAPFTKDCHAPDMTIRQQAAGADGVVMCIKCQGMLRYRVEFIPFQRLRHLLLEDEHGPAQILKRRQILPP